MDEILSFIQQHVWQAWALLAILCLIAELTSGDLFIMCFSIGAAVSAVASAFGLTLYPCLAIFAAVSVLCLLFIRPALLKRMHNKEEKVSNADAIIGRTGKVSEHIEANGYGRIALDGDDWKAVSADGSAIAKGENVKIISRESIIVTVEKL